MSFSPEWDHAYRENTHVSIWPWSDLVTLVMRHARLHPDMRVLELGVGAGANVPFFQAAKVEYFGIDGSAAAVHKLRERYPYAAERFVVADFTHQLPVHGLFDLVVDRASITHNSELAIRACLSLVRRVLKPGGYFIGVDWFSAAHSSAQLGDQVDDAFTRTNITTGHLAGLGKVHFSDAAHLRSLFEDFEIIVLDHKTVERLSPNEEGRLAWYHVVCRKSAIGQIEKAS